MRRRNQYVPRSKADEGIKACGNIFGRDPTTCIIVGLDTDDGPEHSLFDGPSNKRPLTEAGVAYAYTHGIDDPIFLVRDGQKVLVVKGRKRTKELRAANERRVAEGLDPWLIKTIIIPGSHQTPGMRLKRIVENWGLRNERSLMERIVEAQELLDHGDATRDDVAGWLMIKPVRLQAYLELQQLGARAIAGLNEGWLSPSAAAPLTKLSVKDQDEALAKVKPEAKPGKRASFAKVREATGKAEIRTPKVRLSKAATKFMILAPVLAQHLAGLPEDDSIWGDLSLLAHELTDMTWGKLIAGDSELDELPSDDG